MKRAARERQAWQAMPEHIIHRIVAMGEVDGEVAYRAKGDANTRDDGCWVPHSAVDMVSIKR